QAGKNGSHHLRVRDREESVVRRHPVSVTAGNFGTLISLAVAPRRRDQRREDKPKPEKAEKHRTRNQERAFGLTGRIFQGEPVGYLPLAALSSTGLAT